MNINIGDIARICHEANKSLCEALGDFSHKGWWEAADWQRDGAVKWVQFMLDNPQAPEGAQHDAWLAYKQKGGWVYGPVKNREKKEHPWLVPYDKLPREQQAKDALFCAIVGSLAHLLPAEHID